MMDFDYFEPTTLSEASRILSRFKGEARVLAGGTDLVPRIQRKLVGPKALVNIKQIPGLDEIGYKKGKGLTIGPMVTFSDIIGSKMVARRYPSIIETFGEIATPQVRNIATVAGNICNAAPSADSVPILIALGSSVKIYGPGGRTRKVWLEDLFTGPGSILCRPGEMLRSIMVPEARSRTGSSYIKHKTREALEIAVVGVAAMVRASKSKGELICEDARIIVGACAPVPLRVPEAEKVLMGKGLDPGTIEEAARISAETIRPITDVRGTLEYRMDMTRLRTREALVQAWERATGIALEEGSA